MKHRPNHILDVTNLADRHRQAAHYTQKVELNLNKIIYEALKQYLPA